MTRIQRTYSIVLALCLWGVLVVLPEAFFTCGNLYRQFPLYHFLENSTRMLEERMDQETLSEITGRNVEYARRMAKDDKVTEEGENEFKEESIEAGNIELRTGVIEPVARPEIDLSSAQISRQDYLLNQFFIVDEKTSASSVQLDALQFLQKDFSIKKDSSAPQILIYHTHGQETFADSREGEIMDTVIGVGDYLTELLERNYGYSVLHVRESFDLVDGNIDRSKAYDYARSYVEAVLEENPSIEVVIDLHRDGIPENRHLVTTVNGKDTAQILFFNGLSYTNTQGQLDYLPNPYIEENLAFSFQLEYGSALYYPDLYRGIYLAGYRYNLHLKERALLLEAGAQTNTVQEVKNAMEPFAWLLDLILSGKVDCPE